MKKISGVTILFSAVAALVSILPFIFSPGYVIAAGVGTAGQSCVPGSCAAGLYCNSTCTCTAGPGPDSCGTTGGNPSVTASNVSQGPCQNIDVKDKEALGECVVAIYKWSLGLSVILALLMIIFAGYLYMTSGGNAQQVTLAKEFFSGALIGLIVLFCAIIILRTINPELVNFNDIKNLRLN